jgi:hypothetical protein
MRHLHGYIHAIADLIIGTGHSLLELLLELFVSPFIPVLARGGAGV